MHDADAMSYATIFTSEMPMMPPAAAAASAADELRR